MTRVFLKLYLLLLLPLIVISLLPQSPLSLLSSWWGQKEAHRQYGALYPLLMEELSPLDKNKWEAKVIEIAKHFAHPLELKKESEMGFLSDRSKENLASNGFALIYYNNNNTLIYSLEKSGYVLLISLYSKRSDIENFERETRGFRYFLNKKVAESDNPLKEFERIKAFFNIDLTMSKADDFMSENKSESELIESLKKEHLYIIRTKNMNQSYILSSNNEYVITIKNPDSRNIYRQYYKYLSFAIPAILLAFGALLWLFLFKKELNILKSAAKSLGSGELNTRIHLSKNSSLLPISDSFNDMATRIQGLLNGHRDLTNAVSHEFKTPLSRLHFAVEMQETSKTEEEREIYTSKIKQNITSLEDLVGELLSYTRLQRQESLNIQEHYIEKWLDSEIRSFIEYHPNIEVNICIQAKGKLRFDAHLISRALNNLLNNTVTHSNSIAPKIKVTTNFNNNYFHITIEDNGLGIDKSNYEKIFEPFTQLDKSRQKKSKETLGGYGMGLAIVKSIMIQHNGNVSCDRSPLGGAKITLTLPCSLSKIN